MARRVRLKLLGDGWHAYGGVKIPDDREVVVTEAEAAAFLRDRGSARSVEIVGWVDEDTEGETAERESARSEEGRERLLPGQRRQ